MIGTPKYSWHFLDDGQYSTLLFITNSTLTNMTGHISPTLRVQAFATIQDQMLDPSQDTRYSEPRRTDRKLAPLTKESINTASSSIPHMCADVLTNDCRASPPPKSVSMPSPKRKGETTKNVVSCPKPQLWEFKSSAQQIDYKRELRDLFEGGSSSSTKEVRVLLDELQVRLNEYEDELVCFECNLELQQRFLQEKTIFLNRYQHMLHLREQELTQVVRRMRATEALIELKMTSAVRKSIAITEKYESARLSQFVQAVNSAISEFESYDSCSKPVSGVAGEIQEISRAIQRLSSVEHCDRLSVCGPSSDLFSKR